MAVVAFNKNSDPDDLSVFFSTIGSEHDFGSKKDIGSFSDIKKLENEESWVLVYCSVNSLKSGSQFYPSIKEVADISECSDCEIEVLGNVDERADVDCIKSSVRSRIKQTVRL